MTADVDTRRVSNRRHLHFNDLSEVLIDAGKVAAVDAQTLGNWSLAQIFDHLSKSLRVAVEGTDAYFPWPARLLLRPIRGRFFSRPLKPGFRVPSKLELVLRPRQGLSTEQALKVLRAAVAEFESASRLAPHPAFGLLSREEWRQITLRHAELHLSFVLPASESLQVQPLTK